MNQLDKQASRANSELASNFPVEVVRSSRKAVTTTSPSTFRHCGRHQPRAAVRLCEAAILLSFSAMVASAQPPADTAGETAEMPPSSAPAFSARDADHDGVLTLKEFVEGGGRDPKLLERDFTVFDLDHDGTLSLEEFLNVPYLVPIESRGTAPDPIAALVNQHLDRIETSWAERDADRNKMLSPAEFKNAPFAREIPGLEMTGFADWDRNDDGAVSRDECRLTLEIAFGIRRADGEVLRTPSAHVAHWAHFQNVDRDKDDRLNREEFVAGHGNTEEAAAQFERADANGDGGVSFAEWRAHGMHDAVATFLSQDSDLDGRVSFSELMSNSPDWTRLLNERTFAGFDSDQDGTLSLSEHMLLPQFNLVVAWHFLRTDTGGDGRLDFSEFDWGDPRPAMAGLRAEYFRRFDINGDNSLDLDEFKFHSRKPDVLFQFADADANDALSPEEFQSVAQKPAEIAARDFKVFDFNHDGTLSLDAFLNVPYLVPIESRGTAPDPIAALVNQHLDRIEKRWGERDADRNEMLSPAEFKNAPFAREIPGLEMTAFADWDRNGDGAVSRDECRLTLQIAFGIRRADGQVLRTPSAHVAHWAHFQNVDRDKDDRLNREEFVAGHGNTEEAAAQFERADADGDGGVSFAEWRTHGMHDAIAAFLSHDTDLDGRVSFSELMSNSPDYTHLLNEQTFAGFDSDQDGALSLSEHMLLPQFNLVVAWHFLRTDADGDGRLDFSEFDWGDPRPAMAGLRAEYFRRFDVNRDNHLDLDEFKFNLDPRVAPRDLLLRQRDKDNDGVLSLEEVLGDLKIPQPGDRADIGRESLLVQTEEAFRRADANADGSLDLREFSTDDGLEAIAPGSASLNRPGQIENALKGELKLDKGSIRMYAIVGFNAVLLIAVGMYTFLKSGREP